MNYLNHPGFFGTRAPLFMDEITLVVALLPLLLVGAITLAKKKLYKAHAYTQIFIYVASVSVVVYFEYGVRAAGGFTVFSQESGVSSNYLLTILALHIVIATITSLWWSFTVFGANRRLKKKKHKVDGALTFLGVILTSLTGIWVYLLLFVY